MTNARTLPPSYSWLNPSRKDNLSASSARSLLSQPRPSRGTRMANHSWMSASIGLLSWKASPVWMFKMLYQRTLGCMNVWRQIHWVQPEQQWRLWYQVIHFFLIIWSWIPFFFFTTNKIILKINFCDKINLKKMWTHFHFFIINDTMKWAESFTGLSFYLFFYFFII